MIGRRLFTFNKLIAVMLVVLLLPASLVMAADIAVDEDCSLDNAIQSANGGEQVAPLDNCEAGDEDDTAADTITIDVVSTDDGVTTLSSTLSIASKVVFEGGGFTLSGDDSVQVFNIDGGSLEIKNLTVTAGYSDTDGGAISVSNGSLTLTNSVVSASNSGGNGGGIYALDSDLVMNNSAVSGNSISDESDTAGGGIYYSGSESNSLTIQTSGVDNNSSPTDGGGLYLAAGLALISNSTFGENAAIDEGGGIYNAGTSTLTHVTVAFNSAETGGGLYEAARLHLYNSLLSGNSGGDCSGTLNTNIGNLIEDESCGHDELVDDPMLLKLAGLPIYYVLKAGSPAIDAGDPAYCLDADQRAIERPEASCDVGAAEYEAGAFSFQISSAVAEAVATSTSSSSNTQATTATRTPAPRTCENLPTGVTVTGYVDGTECQQRDAGGIGNQIIVDYGFKMAIDFWGYVPGSGVDICIQDTGSIILLDAATSPRTIVALLNTTQGDRRCAHVDREGTAVLMDQAFMTSGNVPDQDFPLAGCTVTTTDILNLRNEPDGDTILGRILNNVSFSAISRTTSWFKVDYFGTIGWISGDYVSTDGSCQ